MLREREIEPAASESSMFERFGVLPSERQLAILPDWLTDEYSNGEMRMVATNTGGLTIVSSPMGITADNSFLDKFITERIEAYDDGERAFSYEATLEAARNIIHDSGIKKRHKSPPLSETRNLTDVMDDAAAITHVLQERAVDVSGLIPDEWFSVNLNFPHSFSQKVGAKYSVRTACAGGVSAIITALANPEYEGKVIGIACSEPLSHMLHPDHFKSLEHTALPTTFADQYSVVIIDRNKISLDDHLIHCIKGGGIRLRNSYDESVADKGEPPSFLNITADSDPNLLIFNETGMYLDIDKPLEPHLRVTMDGHNTTKFFREETPGFIERKKIRLRGFARMLGYHNPSASVLKHINRQIKKLHRINKREGQPLQLRFNLPDIGTGNGTSPTAILDLQRKLMLNKSRLTEIDLLAMGIGAKFIWGRIILDST